jgi:hypothetical protein
MASVKPNKKVTPASGAKMKFIVSDERSPAVVLKAGQKLQVTTVSVVTPELKKHGPIAARLCGGTSTCLAIVEI